MRWEPIVAMAALVAVAIWLVAREGDAPLAVRDGAEAVEVRIGQTERGVLEWHAPTDSYRLLLRDGHGPGEVFDRATAERIFGPSLLRELFQEPPDWLFRVLNITSWQSFAWVLLGLLGQVAFFLRMAVQWIASERSRDSVVPEVFWWLSLAGSVALFTYFVWRKEIVGVLGQAPGVVVYARNLRLIHKRRRRAASVSSAG